MGLVPQSSNKYEVYDRSSRYRLPLPGASYQSVHRLHKREAEADPQFVAAAAPYVNDGPVAGPLVAAPAPLAPTAFAAPAPLAPTTFAAPAPLAATAFATPAFAAPFAVASPVFQAPVVKTV